MCVLQVTPTAPNSKHVDLFAKQDDCDFYFVTHDEPHEDALEFCPNTTWVDTRNTLAEKVPKEYDYYAFVDYDYVFHPQTEKNPLQQMLYDLDKFNPAVLTYYPGNGLITPFASDQAYKQQFEYSIIPFTHCGLKIVHKSLMNWFFPMVTRFGGGVEACHLFNMLEIPFLKNVVCSHQMIYDNGVTDMEAPHNKDGAQSKLNMDRMWMWFYPYFNKRRILRDAQVHHRFGDNIPPRIEEYSSYSDSLWVKSVFVDIFKSRSIPPDISPPDVNYWDTSRVQKVFDLNHEYFSSKKLSDHKRSDILVVVGNGPSLREHYFDIIKEKNVDTFGLNSIYRYFTDMDWYPTYYGCFDYALTESHKEEWSKMILDDDNPIQKYFLIERPSIEANLPHTQRYFSQQIRNNEKFVERPHNQDGIGHPYFGTRSKKISCTGANAVRTGAELGYKKIILIGHDATYVQSRDINQAKLVGGCRYEIEEDMNENPNYFWPDYQRKGDLFHNPGDTVPAWRNMAECLKNFAPDVDVVNCSEGSRIDCFRFGKFEDEV